MAIGTYLPVKGRERSAAPPYPAHVMDGWRAQNGTVVHIRPIAASDADLIRGLVASLSPETRYMRFMFAMKELSDGTIERLTRIDHGRDAALLATDDAADEERAIGVARYAVDGAGETCEFAIVVADDWHRRGLGRHLLALLVDTVAARGLKTIRGDVLAINRPMLAFVTALGFRVGVSADDPALRRVERGVEPIARLHDAPGDATASGFESADRLLHHSTPMHDEARPVGVVA